MQMSILPFGIYKLFLGAFAQKRTDGYNGMQFTRRKNGAGRDLTPLTHGSVI